MKDSFSQMRSFMAKKAPQKLSVEDLKKESEILFVKKQVVYKIIMCLVKWKIKGLTAN